MCLMVTHSLLNHCSKGSNILVKIKMLFGCLCNTSENQKKELLWQSSVFKWSQVLSYRHRSSKIKEGFSVLNGVPSSLKVVINCWVLLHFDFVIGFCSDCWKVLLGFSKQSLKLQGLLKITCSMFDGGWNCLPLHGWFFDVFFFQSTINFITY